MSKVDNQLRKDQLLQESAAALAQISSLERQVSAADRVCWHFGPGFLDGDFDEAKFQSSYYDMVKREVALAFPSMTLDPIAFGSFEIWENVLPSSSWLQERINQFKKFADLVGARLEGWSYEPSDRETREMLGIPQVFAPDAVSEDY